MKFIIDRANFKGSCQSTISGSGRVQFSGELYNQGGENLTFDDYKAVVTAEAERRGDPAPDLVVMDETDYIEMFHKWARDTYLKPATRITAEQYDEALNVLPPEHWTRTGGITHFRMMEYLTGTYTAQYGKLGDQYITKTIDVTDPGTWITADDFTTAQEAAT